jgi:hypothetical protein
MTRTFQLAADSTTADLVDVVQQMKLLPRRTQVLVKRGSLTLNVGGKMRRNRAVAFFEMMVLVLNEVVAR